MHNFMARSNIITRWINDLPDPPSVYKARKRRLNELSDAMEQTPTRRQKMATPNTESEDADHLNTPRPPSAAPLSDTFLVLHPSPSVSSDTSVRSSVARSDTASSQSRAAKRRRSESPKKRLENLTLARYPVVPRSIGTVGELPSSAQRIARHLRKCQLRVGIIHPDNMDAMQPYLDNDDDLTERLFSEQRGRVGDSPCCTEVVSIVEQANENEAERASEAAWNGDVHTALFRTALRHSRWQHELRCDNVTAASIDLDAFSLADYHQDFTEPNSRIDFSIGLRLSQAKKRHLSRCTNAVNPTLYEPVRFAPTALHVETKLTGEGWRAAQSQLSLWVTRHVAKLRELLGLAGQPATTPIPVLPALVVQGHDWTCLFFEDHSDGARLYSGYSVGSTKNVVDAQAVIAALQFLMDWIQTEYRPWFDEMILQPLLAKTS
ncbi:hypothetical protein WHR41_09560 [Cladosporium halotolerans]|uniref:PD-(D/E)XK nuclease-like domain-containing protein n=1 Tax=Cladosporium halotolerans TaxID=1052096 RepID=A0AB34KDK7_9PEZI